MAVKAAIDIVSSTPAPSLLTSNKSSMNKRWPPMADKSSLPYRLTTLSKQKLAREATAPDPDIRRCLGHFRLHCRSMEWAQNDMTTKINSFELEDDESGSEDEEERPILRQGPVTPVTSATPPVPPTTPQSQSEPEVHSTPVNDDSAEISSEQTIHIHFEVSAPPPPPCSADKEKEKDSLVEKGRSCLEKTVQRKSFWPSSQCMPVRITG